MSEQEPKTLDLTGKYETAEEIETGQWFPLECGLRVLIARGGSPEFYKVAAASAKRFGRGRSKEIPGEKNLESLVWVMARANFKSFRDLEGKVCEVQIGDAVHQDTPEGRTSMLMVWPDFRDEIMVLAGSTAEEFQMEIDEAGKG